MPPQTPISTLKCWKAMAPGFEKTSLEIRHPFMRFWKRNAFPD
jgi:hypothetical protein